MRAGTKRLLAAVLSVMMVLSLWVPAGAAPAMFGEDYAVPEVPQEDTGVMPAASAHGLTVEHPAVAPQSAQLSAAATAKIWSWDTKDDATVTAFFTTTGGSLKKGSSASFEGLTSSGMKFQSSGSVSFTVPAGEDGTLTIVAASQSTDKKKSGLQLDGTLVPLTPSKGKVDTITKNVGSGSHTLTPGSKESTLFFLKYAPSHTHAWSDWTVTKEATCTAPGSQERTCSEAGCPIGTEKAEIAIIPHPPEAVAETPATCVTDGLTAGTRCSVCGQILSGCQVIKANGQHHIEGNACTVCGMAAHTEHTWNDGVVTKEATCTDKGVKTYTCTVDKCGETKPEEIAALGHDLEDHAAKEATCTEKGWGAYQTCKRCDHTTYKEIPAKGHTPGADGVCTVCHQVAAKPLTNAGGWFETLYAVLPGIKDADVSAVTYSGPLSGSLDGEDLAYLVRDTADGVRVDIPGIPAGTYTLDVTAGGTTYEATGLEVLEYDRSGYAHYQYDKGVGAYRDDGILKENAIVLYVTEENKNTVSVTSADGTTVTGIGNILNTHGQDVGGGVNSKGGKPNSNQNILRKLAQDGTPLVVRIVGNVSCAFPTPDIDGISLYDSVDYGGSVGDNGNMVRMKGGKDITVEGIGPDAAMDGWGMHFMCQSTDYPLGFGKSFEVRNLSFKNVPEDCIGLEGIQEGSTLTAPVERGWVHNCAFYKPSIKNPAESDKSGGDGACDFKRGNYFTMDYCYYEGYHKTNLVGSSDTSLQYHITWHHNHWVDCESRGPLGRQANMHIYNCLYENQISYAMNPRANCYIFSEYNTLNGCKNAVEIKAGAVKSYQDSFSGCFGNNDATVVTDKSQKVSSGNKYENFDTDPTLSYIPSGDYKLDQSRGEALANIAAYAGPMKAKIVTPDQVEGNVEENRKPTAAVVLPYDKAMDSTSVPSASGTFDNIVFNVQKTGAGEVRLGKKEVGQDIVFMVDEPVDVTITDGGATASCILATSLGEALLEGSGTAKNLPAGTYYIEPSSQSKGIYKEAKITHLKIVAAAHDEKPHEHTWDAGKVTVQPTCTREGVKLFACSGCPETKTEAVDKIAHNYVGGSCSKCGLMEGTIGGGDIPSGEVIPVESLKLDQTTVELEEGMSQRVIATVEPSNATHKTVTWATSDAGVATVAKNGTITGKGAGTATITATADGKTQTVSVTVIGIVTNGYTFIANKDNPIQGDMSTAQVDVANGTKWGTKEFFTNNGGKNKWQAKNFNGKKPDKTVGSLLLATGAGSSLDFTVPAGTTARKVTINFSSTSSSNTSAIALKGPDGKLVTGSGGAIAAAKGTGSTPVTYENLPAGTYQILVPSAITPEDLGMDSFANPSTDDPNTRGARLLSVSVDTAQRSDGQEIVAVNEVRLDKTTAEMKVGENLVLNATVLPANASNKTITWISTDTNVATVAAGTVTARKAGTATIKAIAGGREAACAVTVAAGAQAEGPLVSSIAVTGDAKTVTVDPYEDQILRLSYTVLPDDAANKTLNWTSSAYSEGVEVDAYGVVTVRANATAAGEVTITATATDGSAVQGKFTLTVKPAPVVAVNEVALNAETLKLSMGGTKTAKLVATVKPQNATNKAVTWTSSAPEVVEVDDKGNLTALKDGSATITVLTDDGHFTATCQVTVSPAVAGAVHAESVALDKTALALKPDETAQLTVTFTPADATDKAVQWTSSDENVATVDDQGLVTAGTAGSATITVTAEDGGKTATCAVVVTPADVQVVHVESVTLNRSSLTLKKGYSSQLKATLTPTDATIRAVTWTSSDETVATVDDHGLVTAVENGSATITATTADGGKTATCAVTVSNSQGGGGSSSGSGSGSGSAGNTVIRPDGTKVTTVQNGSVTTQTIVSPSGNTLVVNTKADGSATATEVHADGTLAITNTTADGQTTTKVTVPAGVDKTVVTIPAKDLKPGAVAVLVKADGSETPVPMSAQNEDGMAVLLEGDAKIKLTNAAKSYVDVPGHWAEDQVDFVSARAIFNGTDETHFAPNSTMTRGMMATVLFRLNGQKKSAAHTDFADVTSGTWYQEAVDWAAETGVVTGYDDATFAPDDNVTREQLAVMIYRYAKAAGLVAEDRKAGKLDYADADKVSDWATEAVSWLTANGILTGKPGSLVDPSGNATRAEVATVLERFIEFAI